MKKQVKLCTFINRKKYQKWHKKQEKYTKKTQKDTKKYQKRHKNTHNTIPIHSLILLPSYRSPALNTIGPFTVLPVTTYSLCVLFGIGDTVDIYSDALPISDSKKIAIVEYVDIVREYVYVWLGTTSSRPRDWPVPRTTMNKVWEGERGKEGKRRKVT